MATSPIEVNDGDVDSAHDEAPVFTEGRMALDFADAYTGYLRYVSAWSKWLHFNGARWASDEVLRVWAIIRRLCFKAATAINKPSAAKVLASAKCVAAVERLAKSDTRLAATVDQWDADPLLLNTPSGVVELGTAKMREHRATDYMTKITNVAPDAKCPTPLWDALLNRVTEGDKEYQAYLARVFGYSLTGSTVEHAMFFLFGTGGNGKSTLLNAISYIVGDYGCTAAIETFVESHGERHPTELAKLRGARLVVSIETEEGRRWAEAKIKALTGGDRISARFMRMDFFEYEPQFKLLIAGNNKPGLRTVDAAIRRRFNLLPFVAKISEEDKDVHYGDKLKAEAPGILAWMIAGCLDWQRVGLAPPKVVTEATNAYLEAEDNFTNWFDDGYVEKAGGWITSRDLFSDWSAWAHDHNELPGSAKKLSQHIENRGFKRDNRTTQGGRGFVGIAKRSTPGEASDAEIQAARFEKLGRDQEFKTDRKPQAGGVRRARANAARTH